jgi:MOSC domain-containing protein YiiM
MATVCILETKLRREGMNGHVYIVISKTKVKAGDNVTVELGAFVGVWRPLG